MFGSVLGADGVGRIAEIKGQSSKLKVGDRVVVMPSNGWTKDPRGPEEAYYILGGGHSQGKKKKSKITLCSLLLDNFDPLKGIASDDKCKCLILKS